MPKRSPSQAAGLSLAFTMIVTTIISSAMTVQVAQAFKLLYPGSPGYKIKNVTAIAWKDNLIFQSLFNPFVTAKNDWDATSTKVGFLYTIVNPTLTIHDYNSNDGFRGKTFTMPPTGTADVYLNYNYLQSDNDTRRRSTTGHEIGHALGLDHPTGAVLMNDTRNRDQVFSPKLDDVNGVNSIYGNP